MKVSTKSRYGMIILIDLARHDGNGPVQVGEISKRQDISVKYLEQLILQLKKANLITSIRGAKGGHVLAKDPRQITIGHVFKIFETNKNMGGCFCNQEDCRMADACRVRNVWQEAIETFYEKLESTSIADIKENICCE